MNSRDIERMIMDDEGTVMEQGRHVVYICPAGHRTIGYGTNLDAGLSEDEALLLLRHRIAVCVAELEIMFNGTWTTLPDPIRAVLINMIYTMGGKRMRGFKDFIQAVKDGSRAGMIRELKDSVWYGKAKNRVDRLIKMIDGCGSLDGHS